MQTPCQSETSISGLFPVHLPAVVTARVSASVRLADYCQKGGSLQRATLALKSDVTQRVVVKPWTGGERSIGREAAIRGSWHRVDRSQRRRMESEDIS
jgi:hypothetical protein